MITISYEKLHADVEILAKKIKENMAGHSIYDNIYAVPRGGMYAGTLLAELLELELVDNPDDLGPFTLVVDDLIDSGHTRKKFWDQDFAVLYKKPTDKGAIPTYFVEEMNDWIEFPWENTTQDVDDNIIRLLEFNEKDTTEHNIQKVKTFLEDL